MNGNNVVKISTQKKGKLMNSRKVVQFLFLVSASSLAFASGNHSGGHGHASSDSGTSHWLAPEKEAAKHNPIQSTDNSLKTGSNLYQQNCMSCHGVKADGKGSAGLALKSKPANLLAMAGTHPDGDFAYKIMEGRGEMPAWKMMLSDNQVWHLVNYIQSLNKNPVGSLSEGRSHKDEHEHGS